MSFKYRIGKPLNGFVPIKKWASRYQAELTINWFLDGVKPLVSTKIGRIDSIRFIK